MKTEFHRYLFEHIKRNAKPETVLAQELVALLQQSKANIYKKLNGNVPFSGEEIVRLARHFGISLDQYIHNGHSGFDKVSFDYSLPQHQPRTPLQFLEKIRYDMERIAQLPQPMIRYASNEVPIFHSIMSRNVLAFKLYVWSRTNWKLPELLNSPFNPDEIYERWPALEEHRLATYGFYQQIPSIEYWPRIILNNFLNQIRYYANANLFQDSNMPAILHAELLDMLQNLEQLAAVGNKGLLPNGEKAAKLNLFLNEISFSTHIIMIYNTDKPVALYTTVDHPNFLRTSDEVFCGRMHQWATQIEGCSFPMSNEQHRISLFQELNATVHGAR
jgi:hypothetical protein